MSRTTGPAVEPPCRSVSCTSGGDHNFRVAPRSISHKPAVFLSFFPIYGAGFVAHQLRGAGLAGEIDVLQPQRYPECPPPSLTTPYIPSSPARRCRRKSGNARFSDRSDFSRGAAAQRAAARDGCNHARQLNRRDGDRALPDGDRYRLARIPLVMVTRSRPFFRRHQARLFAGQINSRAAAKAQARRRSMNAVDPQRLPMV